MKHNGLVLVPPPTPSRRQMPSLGVCIGTMLSGVLGFFLATSFTAYFYQFLTLRSPAIALVAFQKKEKALGYPREAA